MAKKNKKFTKINQKIRKYFDEDPFDMGVERVSTETLSDLFHTLGIYDIEYSKEILLRSIRSLWSDGDIETRQEILNFFASNGTIYKSKKLHENNFDRTTRIEALIEELDVTPAEAIELYESFKDVRSKKITVEKMESKLAHIRFDDKKKKIEKQLGGVFALDDSFEFNASFRYDILGSTFHKILTLHTKPYEYLFLRDEETELIVDKITKDKETVVLQKQKQIDTFISSLKIPHPYLSDDEIVMALRIAPPDSKLDYPFLDEVILSAVVAKDFEVQSVKLHEEEFLVTIHEKTTLPFREKETKYLLDVHLELNPLLEAIWNAKQIDFDTEVKAAKAEHEQGFLIDLEYLVKECGKYAALLHLSDEALHLRVYEHLLPHLPNTLHLSAKLIRKTVKRFLHHIQDEIIKKQRQELLARTIRDFKNLFPIARGLRRKLTLHIGPTNSGKTYQAMQKLKAADTGYYLAPLRLLALEGYEDLKEDGVDVSLITGEEQLLNEDATHISSTIEMLNFDVDVDVCVIDEVQMIDDRDRGWAWANAIIGAPASQIIMTGSSNAREAIIALAEYLGEELEIIEFERKNPLTLLETPTHVKEVEAGSAIIAFSRKDVLKLKQNFARFFNVSVVYGNLSPEVRREEARRFRGGETEILIATDAIAMGLNLPIKTILFSKADKFDGVTQRDLFPSEVHQISGRAGRYGLNEEGFVGALNGDVLKVIKRTFQKDDRAITIPFKVMANLEHIKLVNTILEENSLSEILKFFVQNMEFNGPFRATNLDDMVEAALIVDNYDLDIATKYHLSCAPLTLKSPYILGAFESYILALEHKKPIYYNPPKLMGTFAQTTDELLRAEDMVKEISLYLWLSYRFKDYFVDADRAREHRGVLNRFIEESLQQSHFVPKCRMCAAALPLHSNYSICQSCFRKNYARKGFRRGGR